MVTIHRANGQQLARRPASISTTHKNGLPFETSGPDETKFINGLFYADTGAGKTFLLGTAIRCPEMMPALLVDIDGGTLTLQGIPESMISIARPKNWREVQEIYRYFYFDNTRFRSLFIDTLTETQRRHSMGTILGEIDQGQGGYYKNLESTPVANRQDWLKSSGQVTKVIQAFRGLSYLRDVERRVHVIFTAHEKLNDRQKVVGPELPGALSMQCGRWVDILGRLSVHDIEEEDEEGNVTVRTVRHLLVTQYTDHDGLRYLAKNRGGRLGQSIWDPTMTKIAAAWRGEQMHDGDGSGDLEAVSGENGGESEGADDEA
jgi:hypothetical protein